MPAGRGLHLDRSGLTERLREALTAGGRPVRKMPPSLHGLLDPPNFRHGVSAADIAESRPVLRTVSTSSTPPACETTVRPPPSCGHGGTTRYASWRVLLSCDDLDPGHVSPLQATSTPRVFDHPPDALPRKGAWLTGVADQLREAHWLDFSRDTLDASQVQAERGRSHPYGGPSPVARGATRSPSSDVHCPQ